MTPHLSEASGPSGCPCGRSHPDRRARRRSVRKPEVDLRKKIGQAFLEGAAQPPTGPDQRWSLHYAGNCLTPITLGANDDRRHFATRAVRCRRCRNCVRARTWYWGLAAIAQTLASHRTWFGTLTLTPEWQHEFLVRARLAHPDGEDPFWEDPKCDERFSAVRDLLLKEVQKYWKRLRKQGHEFSYFLVFERHKSGLPHMHFLLHEKDKPITKRAIQGQWPYGFSNVSIVGGRSKHAAAPDKAAWYVVKYLSKSAQARQIASKGYRPVGRVPEAQKFSDLNS